jgi:hypothetical protein
MSNVITDSIPSARRKLSLATTPAAGPESVKVPTADSAALNGKSPPDEVITEADVADIWSFNAPR